MKSTNGSDTRRRDLASLLTSNPDALETGHGFEQLLPGEDLVSVIVPAYSHQQFVEEALRSIVRQTHRRIEIILIDDESPDHTFELALTVLREGGLPFCAIRRRHAGMDVNVNTGILIANGNWVALLASDDAFPPQAFEALLAAARQDGADVAIGSVQDINRDASLRASRQEFVSRYRSLPRHMLRKALLEEHGSLMLQGMLISRRVYARVGLFDHQLMASDFDFLIRMAGSNVRLAFLDQITALHRVTRQKLSQDHIRQSLRSHLWITRRHARSLREYRLGSAIHLCEAAANSLHYRYYPDALSAVVRAFALAPLRTAGYFLRRLRGRLSR